jgi:hypothetical protein
VSQCRKFTFSFFGLGLWATLFRLKFLSRLLSRFLSRLLSRFLSRFLFRLKLLSL